MQTMVCGGRTTMDAREDSGSRLTLADLRLATLILLAAVLIFHQLAVAGVVGTFHDDGVYVSTAKALAEGKGYHLINFPGSPPQTKYPVLFPLLLSLLWQFQPEFPQNLAAMQWLTSCSAALFLALTYLYFVRFIAINRWVAFLGCMFCCTISSFAFFSAQVLSELPFALAVVLALILFDSYLDKKEGGFLEKVILGLALAVPAMIRLAGIALPAACLLLLWRRGKPFATVMAASAAFLLALLAYMSGAAGSSMAGAHEPVADQVRSYHTDYLGWWLVNGAPYEANVISRNLEMAMNKVGELMLSGLVSHFNLSDNADWESTFRLLGALILFGLCWRTRTRSLSWFVAAYCLVICAWPWPPFRFLIPVLPYLAVAAFEWLYRIAGALPPLFARTLLACVVIPIWLYNINDLYQLGVFTQASKVPLMAVPQDPISWRSFREATDWIRENSKKDDVIATTYDALMYLYSGRQSIRPYSVDAAASFYGKKGQTLGSPEQLLANLKRYHARFLVLTPQPDYVENKTVYRLIDNVAASHEGLLTVVYTCADSRFVIVEIDRARLDK